MFCKITYLTTALVTIFSISSTSLAQESITKSRDEFKYLGINIMASTPTNGTYDGTKVSAGIEGVYLKKISDKFSLGFSGSYGLWKTRKDEDVQPAQYMTPAFNASSSRPYQRYNLSILMGMIFDHKSEARSILTFGPTYDANIAKISIDRDYGDNPVPSDPWLAEHYEIEKSDHYYGLTLGYYHERPSNLTFGLVTTGGMTMGGPHGSPDFYATGRFTIGYSF